MSSAFQAWVEKEVDAAIKVVVTQVLPNAAHLIPGMMGQILSSVLAQPEVQQAEIALADKGVADVLVWAATEIAKLKAFLESHVSAQVQALAAQMSAVVVHWGPDLMHTLQASALAGTLLADMNKMRAAVGLPPLASLP